MYSSKKKDIYAALKPHSFDFPLPLEGKLTKVWESCEAFGCISGFGGIVEFSPIHHIENVLPSHLQIYEQTKLQCTFKEAYDIMAIMARQLGWTELLRLRSTVFVMEDEYNESVLSEQQKEQNEILTQQQQQQAAAQAKAQAQQQLLIPTNGNGNGRRRSSSVSSAINGSNASLTRISTRFRSKRLSERWLDSLFLIFYENLRSALIWANERANAEDITTLQHIPLEWELIADECFKVHHFEQAMIPMKTCLDTRFSIFACTQLLEYYLYYTTKDIEFRKLNGIKTNFQNGHSKVDGEDSNTNGENGNANSNNTNTNGAGAGANASNASSPTSTSRRIASYALPEDYILKLVCKMISWNYRFYGEFSLLAFQVLKNLIASQDAVLIKSKLETFFNDEDPVTRHSIVGLVDRYISWLQQFDNGL
ncbi:unnamed protein product [Ambrosiozyma monospora]|uniref:Unnamed protein product n=1 Tax=Ambrosiozyma monospora TaxID=43982 RepID=A0ACB5T6T3_AMBMO|nr:unnamed protein product [Ambrosiozyma monospora]